MMSGSCCLSCINATRSHRVIYFIFNMMRIMYPHLALRAYALQARVCTCARVTRRYGNIMHVMHILP